MALGKEISDFVSAFGTGARISQNNEYLRLRKAAIKTQNPDDFSTVKDAAAKYKAQYGSGAPDPTNPGGAALPATTAPTDTGGWGGKADTVDTGVNSVASSTAGGDYDALEAGETYARGGPVRQALPVEPEYVHARRFADGGAVSEAELRRAEEIAAHDREAAGDPTDLAYPGAGAARAPIAASAPRQAIPTQVPPQATAVLEPRKALNDQTRVAAFDPESEGMPAGAPSVTRAGNDVGVAAPRQAIALNPATNNGGDGLTSNADPNDPQSTNNVASDLQKAIHGGLTYATHMFHLKGDGALPGTDPHQAKGRRAFIDGVGAATPKQVQEMDAVVNQGVPPNEAVWGIRRLEAIYRHYSMNGETDKANKAAFELMQYSAGAAAQYGHAALQSVYRGDMKQAAELVIKGHEMIPDGRTLKIGPDGKSVNVIDARTGATEGNMPFDPKALFNAALGLSNKSLYWDVLSHRAAGTAPGQKPGKPTSETDEELKKARTELIKARTNKIKAGPAGKPGQSGAMGALLDEIKAIDAKRGVAPTTTPPRGGARAPNAAGEGGADPAEDTSDEEERPAALEADPSLKPNSASFAPDSVVRLRPPPAGSAAAPPDAAASAPSGGNGDGQPVGTAPGSMVNPSRAAGSPVPTPAEIAAGAKPTVRQTDGSISTEKTIGVEVDGKHYVLPTIIAGKSLTPGAAVAAFKAGKIAPLGEFKTEGEATAFAEQRSRNLDAAFGGKGVLRKGPSSPADGSLNSDPDAVPDKEIWRDGGTSRPAPAGDQPRPYDEAHPGANPYSALLTKAASLPGREGVQARVLIQAKMHEFDKEIAAWNGRKKTHDASEKQRITSTGKEMRDAQKQQLKDTFISNVRPADRKKIDTDIGGAFDTAVATAKHGGKDPTKLAANEAADALEKNKDAYSKSVFSDPSVDPQRFKSIAADLMTTNPRPGALGAVHLATDLTRIDPQDATTRAFQPMGRDALGNVVVRSPSYGLVHIRPDTYADIVNVVKSRLKNAATEGKAAAEKAATDAGSRRSSEIVDRVKGAVSRAVDKATTVQPSPTDRTLIDDIGEGGRAIAAGTRRALSGIPWGDNAAMEERIRGYRRP